LARFYAPLLSENIPGTPNVDVINMPGAGSTKGANWFSSEAPIDGKTIFSTSGSTQFPFLLGDPRVKYNYNDWEVILASSTGGVAYLPSDLGELWESDLESALDVNFVFASQGPTRLDLVPLLAWNMLGMNVEPIFGIKGRADGISLTKNIRKRSQIFPIIILTARGATRDRVIGLDAGADDYLVKPFKMDELYARIRALSRRVNPLLAPIEKIGTIEFDRNSRRIFFKNLEVTINRRELTLFEILLNKKGQYISKSHLVDTQYGVGADVNTNAIEISISRLRKILSEYDIKITTARGIGYMMDDSE
ncbi:winged helix-turn-helix domain-containing protein, partial [Candidatus Thioglobus sp.]|nr:winged helix-turn-helix domain-containing protein [Candidatus Thioglobus sp.]